MSEGAVCLQNQTSPKDAGGWHLPLCIPPTTKAGLHRRNHPRLPHHPIPVRPPSRIRGTNSIIVLICPLDFPKYSLVDFSRRGGPCRLPREGPITSRQQVAPVVEKA